MEGKGKEAVLRGEIKIDGSKWWAINIESSIKGKGTLINCQAD